MPHFNANPTDELIAMSYKTILVCLTTTTNAKRLMHAACLLARKFDAHLIGLHTLQSIEVYPGIAVDLPRQAVETFDNEQSRQAEAIKAEFDKAVSGEDFTSEWRQVKAQSANAADRMVEHALCSDLIVMGQADPDNDRADQRDAQEQVIRQSGRPVLVIPSVGEFKTIGEHALIGWSATRESSRSLHDAVPLLTGGGKATILWVSHGEKDAAYLESTAHAVAGLLDRQGVEATVAHWQNTKIAIADALLNEAFERGADMIVTGAFGHSRFYDFVIGATTTGLLEHMTVPVLFSN
jgi:nucleotide-binding universal stress UspA family protein